MNTYQTAALRQDGGAALSGTENIREGGFHVPPVAQKTTPELRDAPPPSCTVTWINAAGLASLIAASCVVRTLGLPLHVSLMLVLTAPALTIIALEYLFIRSRIPFSPRDPSGCFAATATKLSRSERILLKLLGLACSVAALTLIYWLFPIYRNGTANHLFEIVRIFWLPVALLAPLYVWFVDKRMSDPEDAYFHAGLVIVGEWHLVDWNLVRQHMLQWMVKGFFLPLMLVFCTEKIQWMIHNPFEPMITQFILAPSVHNWLLVYEYLFVYLLFIDVSFASIGYFLTLKLFDSHVRTAEPTTLGWLVCLVCYPPFWNMVGAEFFAFHPVGMPWGYWLGQWPALMVLWSVLILGLYFIYAMATVQFGIRFSNLTHRGVITNGIYRWIKHPAYVSKNLVWWLFYLPFLTTHGANEAIRASVLLLGVNFIYYMRARTEERHLSNDPVYREYLVFMKNHDLFAVSRRALARLLKGRAPEPKMTDSKAVA